MIDSLFQNSKSALIFAGAVIFSALMLVGSEDSGGVLDKAVSKAKSERTSTASAPALAPSPQMSEPTRTIAGPASQPSDLGHIGGMEYGPGGAPQEGQRAIRLDPTTLQPIDQGAELPAS